MSIFSALDNSQRKAHIIGLILSAVHISLFFLTIIYVKYSSDPQASLIWIYFTFVDLPTIPIYFIPNLGSIIYVPYLAHGIFGTLLWYVLPRIFMKKDHGGVWRNQKLDPDKLSIRYMLLGLILFSLGMGINEVLGAIYFGIIFIFLGIFFLVKGRSVFDRIIPPKPWEKGPD